jgi:DNA-directed RNA polymerase subunit RPC12/RpoP
MPLTDFSLAEQAVLEPERTRCGCKRSAILPAHPKTHCPKCHKTWTARTLHYPVECPACGFRLISWRRRNAIPELFVPYP